MSRYLVTGAAGFIGSQVCQDLLQECQEVVGVDSLNDAYDVSLKERRLGALKALPGFRFLKLDICREHSQSRLSRAARSCKAVIHLAARAGVRQSIGQPNLFHLTNVLGTQNLLEVCRHTGVGKFVLASSSSVYGQVGCVPVREDMPTDRPLSPYAASKKAAELIAYAYHHLYGLDVTVFRYFTVYGPSGRPDMSPFRFLQWISEGRPVAVYGDGSQLRDFTNIKDIARGTILGLQPVGFEVFNLGAGQPVRLLDYVRLLERHVGRTAVLEFHGRQLADVSATWADVTKAREILNWTPCRQLDEGTAELVEWYRQNSAWARQIET